MNSFSLLGNKNINLQEYECTSTICNTFYIVDGSREMYFITSSDKWIRRNTGFDLRANIGGVWGAPFDLFNANIFVSFSWYIWCNQEWVAFVWAKYYKPGN